MDLETLTYLVEANSKLKLSIDLIKDKQVFDRFVQEGYPEMSKEEKDAYKAIIGDGKASVTVSRDLSEMSFGSGGKVFVSVTLNVDQSEAGIKSGYEWASFFVNKKIWEARAELKTQLVKNGIIKEG